MVVHGYTKSHLDSTLAPLTQPPPSLHDSPYSMIYPSPFFLHLWIYRNAKSPMKCCSTSGCIFTTLMMWYGYKTTLLISRSLITFIQIRRSHQILFNSNQAFLVKNNSKLRTGSIDPSSSRRVGQDRFYLIREVWDKFVSDCISEYHPSPFLTVDEQLLPTKAGCPFTQYMPNKPGKFGIKFWMLADAEKPYIMNVRPYLGKNFDDERGGVRLGVHVVLKLMEPYIDKGYNVTTDNFFTSMRLAKQLGRKKTTLAGIMRGNRKEMPPSFTAKKRQLHSVLQGHNVEASCTLLSSQVKKAKVVNVLSAMHGIEPVSQDGSTKPAIIEFYNSTKFGVDRVDQMCRLYSSKAGGRRWPVNVFSNMIDMAGINSRTIFELASGNSISQRQFLLNLAEQLVESYRSSRSVSEPLPAISQQSEQRRKCHICHKNKTRVACSKCGKPVCGKCTKPVLCRKC